MYKYIITIDECSFKESNFKFLTEEDALSEAEEVVELFSDKLHRHPVEFDIDILKI